MGDTILGRPRSGEVTLGGQKYRVGEIRPTDLEALRDFMALFPDNGPEDLAKGLEGLGVLNAIPRKAVELWVSKPDELCRLLATILDPAPLDPSGGWVEAKAKEFKGLPVAELNGAVEAWMKTNAFFLADMLAPLITGAAHVLMLDAERRLRGLAEPGTSSGTGTG
jgi:hypothetical protein